MLSSKRHHKVLNVLDHPANYDVVLCQLRVMQCLELYICFLHLSWKHLRCALLCCPLYILFLIVVLTDLHLLFPIVYLHVYGNFRSYL